MLGGVALLRLGRDELDGRYLPLDGLQALEHVPLLEGDGVGIEVAAPGEDSLRALHLGAKPGKLLGDELHRLRGVPGLALAALLLVVRGDAVERGGQKLRVAPLEHEGDDVGVELPGLLGDGQRLAEILDGLDAIQSPNRELRALPRRELGYEDAHRRRAARRRRRPGGHAHLPGAEAGATRVHEVVPVAAGGHDREGRPLERGGYLEGLDADALVASGERPDTEWRRPGPPSSQRCTDEREVAGLHAQIQVQNIDHLPDHGTRPDDLDLVLGDGPRVELGEPRDPARGPRLLRKLEDDLRLVDGCRQESVEEARQQSCDLKGQDEPPGSEQRREELT